MTPASPSAIDPALPAALQVCDAHGRLTAVTDAWLALLGYSRARVLGEPWQAFLAESPAGVEPADILVRAAASPQVLPFRRADGASRLVELRASPSSPAGETTAALIDVSAYSARQLDLQHQLERVQALLVRNLNAVDAAGIGTFEFDIAAQVAHCGPGTRRLLGCAPGDVISYADWAAAVHPEDRGRALEVVQNAIRTNEPYTHEYRVIWPDGAVHWLQSRGRFELVQGAPRLLGALLDITAQRRAELALREQEALYRAVVADLPDLVFRWRPDTTLTFASPAFCHFLGLNPAGCEATRWLDWLPASARERLQRHVAELIDGVNPESPVRAAELHLSDAAGVPRVLRCVDRGLFSAGQLVEFQSAWHDVTVQFEAEARVRASRDRFQRFFDNCPVHLREIDISRLLGGIAERRQAGILDFDAYLRSNPREILNIAGLARTVAVNPAFLRFVGFATLEQYHAGIERALTPRQVERTRQQLVELAAGQVPSPFETTIRTPAGEREVLVHVSELERDAAGLRTLLYSSIDVTEHRRLQSQLRELQELDAVGALAAGVAHDVNNVLTAILGHAELARLNAADPDAVVRAADGILDAGRQATEMVRTLQTFGRAAERDFEPVHLGHLLVEATRLIRRIAPMSIELDSRNDFSGEPWVQGDGTRLLQLLMNLAINSRDAMPNGGRMRVALAPAEGQAAALILEDNGCGMDQAVLARLFEPFFTTKPRGQGTGLGMSMVQAIVQDHRGTITVDSAPGQGTRITVVLPTIPPPVRAAPAAAVAAGQGRTVLLGEDNPQVRAILETTLRRGGYKVLAARDGAELLELFTRNAREVDAVIADIDLPKVRGEECLRRMRAARPDLPAIVITGDVEATPDSLGVGDVVLLHKPFRTSELLGTLARACNPRQAANGPVGPP